jgi:hypothetical protein
MNSQHVPSQLASMLGAGHRDAEIYLLRKVLYTHVRPQVAVQILWSLAWCLPVKDLRLPVVVEGITGCDMLFLICPQIIAKHADRRVTSWLEIFLSSGLRGTQGRRVGRHFGPRIISIRERPSFRVIPEGYVFCHIPLKRPEMKGMFHQLSR